jgi:ribosomal protein S21
MIKVTVRSGESFDRMLKRFGGHVKSRGLLKIFRNGRYFVQKPTDRKVRDAAVKREGYRAATKKRQFLS